jgi:hypothetical protein
MILSKQSKEIKDSGMHGTAIAHRLSGREVFKIS